MIQRFFGAMSTRVFAILLSGILVSVFLTGFVAFGERQRTMAQFREGHVLDLAEHLFASLDGMLPTERPLFLARANRHYVRLEAWQEGANPAKSAAESESESQSESQSQSQSGKVFGKALATRLGTEYAVQVLANKPRSCMRDPERGRTEPLLLRLLWRLHKAPPPLCERIWVRLPDQSRFVLTILPPRNFAPPPYLDLTAISLFVMSVALLAYWVAQMTMRPLGKLAQAAGNLGRDINHPPLPVRGTTEIRQASAAFNAMQARIRQHITQRTHMLAAITHDLQTPLTRLRLRLEKVQDVPLREKLIDDLAAMQNMVREGLDLARSIDSSEAMQSIDIDSLLDSVCSDAIDAGQAVQLQGQTGACILGRPLALRRCLVNLIDNALKYGQCAQVFIERGREFDSELIHIRIQDQGHGIPPDQLQRVFEPFYRIESSRSREFGGTGLGLTIANNIAEQHGGRIILQNLPAGGLEACLSLPCPLR